LGVRGVWGANIGLIRNSLDLGPVSSMRLVFFHIAQVSASEAFAHGLHKKKMFGFAS